MLILLPPSEGKSKPESGEALLLDSLFAAGELTPLRASLVKGLDLGPTRPAHEIYSGVLYQALDWSSLPDAAKKRGESSILIISSLFGALRITDLIPTYKAKMMARHWKPTLAGALEREVSGLVIDARSSTYLGVWRPPTEKTIVIKVFQVKEGAPSVITHMSKKYRGELVRHLLQSPTPTTPQELLALAQERFDSVLSRPNENEPWELELRIHRSRGE